MNTIKTARRNERAGFTLTEIAIVLGIIGLILGAIWVAASGVYASSRNADANKGLLAITQKVRSVYATQTQVDTANGADETTALIRAGVFPSNMLNTGVASTATAARGPWNGSTIKVWSAQTTSTGDSFEIQFIGVPQQACIELLTATTGTSRDQGLIHAQGRATAGTYLTTPVGTPVTTHTVGTATTSCASATSNDVIFVFALRG